MVHNHCVVKDVILVAMLANRGIYIMDSLYSVLLCLASCVLVCMGAVRPNQSKAPKQSKAIQLNLNISFSNEKRAAQVEVAYEAGYQLNY